MWEWWFDQELFAANLLACQDIIKKWESYECKRRYLILKHCHNYLVIRIQIEKVVPIFNSIN